MFCIYCGNKLPDGAKFCPNCGDVIEDQSADFDEEYGVEETEDIYVKERDGCCTASEKENRPRSLNESKNKRSAHRFVLCVVISLIVIGVVAVGGFFFKHPEVRIGDVFEMMSMASVETTIQEGDLFTTETFAATPIEMSFGNCRVYTDNAGWDKLSVDITITNRTAEKWMPSYSDFLYFQDGTNAFLSPEISNNIPIARGERNTYTFVYDVNSWTESVIISYRTTCVFDIGLTVDMYIDVEELWTRGPYGGENGSVSSADGGNDFSATDYSQYNLTLYQGGYTDESHSIELSERSDGASFDCTLYWFYGNLLEQGVVVPGVPTQLSEGTVITVDLNTNGSIHVMLEWGQETCSKDMWSGDRDSTSLNANVTAKSEYDKFIGFYSGDDAIFDVLSIEWEGSNLRIECSGYRETYFVATIPTEDSFKGAYLSFVGQNPYTNDAYDIKLAYAPASDSPHKVDTIYLLSDDLFQMAYKRTEY